MKEINLYFIKFLSFIINTLLFVIIQLRSLSIQIFLNLSALNHLLIQLIVTFNFQGQ